MGAVRPNVSIPGQLQLNDEAACPPGHSCKNCETRGIGEGRSAHQAASDRNVSGHLGSAVLDLTEAGSTPSIRRGRMSEWIINGPGVDPPISEVLLDEVRHGAVRHAARQRLAIQLMEMVVHHNRRWFGETAVRLDVLIVHGGTTTAEYAPTTLTFPRVGDGDRLPIGDGGLLLFHGRPKWYLTMFIAVSRDKADASPLSALLTDLVTSEPAVALQAQALALATGVPDPQLLGMAWQSALLVGEAMLTALRRETGATIGVYRDSWLRGRDRWGVGRHPADGLLTAKDVSFAFEILEEPA